MELQKITLFGIKSGVIWYPAVEAKKEFKQVYTPSNRPFSNQWTGFRNAFLSLTNDGDFQTCAISEIYGQAEYKQGNRFIIIPLKFNPYAKVYSDCLTEDCIL
jgi:hypothetical protein